MMTNAWEFLKKLGASIIVLLLVLMLAITFSSQPMDEIIDLISGSSKVGHYYDQPISLRDYSLVYSECENQLRKYGLTEIPPIFLKNCITQNIVSLYVKPVIAEDLGLGVSKEFVEHQIIEYVKEVYQVQKRHTLADDIVPMEELYQRELRTIPLQTRISFLKANLTDNFLLTPINTSMEDWNIVNSLARDEIEIELSIIAFSNMDLMNQINVSVSEEEIQTQYEKDKQDFFSKEENQQKEYPSLKERYKFIEENLKNEKKRKEVSKIKEELNKLNVESIEDLNKVQQIVNVPPSKLLLSLKQLQDGVVINNKKVFLLHKDILNAILNNNNKVLGPIQDRENTLYVKLLNVKKQTTNINKNVGFNKEEVEKRLSFIFYDYILEQYKKRGKFQLNDLVDDVKNKN